MLAPNETVLPRKRMLWKIKQITFSQFHGVVRLAFVRTDLVNYNIESCRHRRWEWWFYSISNGRIWKVNTKLGNGNVNNAPSTTTPIGFVIGCELFLPVTWKQSNAGATGSFVRSLALFYCQFIFHSIIQNSFIIQYDFLCVFYVCIDVWM